MHGPSLPDKNRWIETSRLSGRATLRLFCFPWSGAGASVYYKWAGTLPPEIEVCPVQLPGRESRLNETAFTSLEALAAAAGAALRPWLDRPFAFFGHSMGALVSFEIARWLRRLHGLSPAHLLVSGHTAPHLPRDYEPIHALPEPEFVAELRRLNGTPEAVLSHEELRALILPVLRADFSVCETYVYPADEPLACPISVFGGLQDTDVSREKLEAWREQTTGSFSLRMFPGDHFYLLAAQHHLLRAIALELEPTIRSLNQKT
ncbi:MAG TPA: thioesterase domain-containing protein [Blastocatellia bacterium]|nr:thioesterase domain-containing protein [Blastocatellia bacterium]